MESKNTLAATSLFCNQRNWPILLREIQNFNKTIYKKSPFYIEFNYLSGDNIRFSPVVHQKTAEEQLKHIDDYFKRFFCNFKPETKKQSGDIFKGFELNSIYYGLYDPISIKKGEKRNYTLQFILSKLIIDALKDEERLDDETILTLAYYFTIAVIKVALENYHLNEKVLTTYFREQYQQLDVLDHKMAQAKFKENKSILLEIYNSLGEKESPRWIKKWQRLLGDFMHSNSKETISRIIPIFGQVKKQLGLNSTMQSMLCYFIFRTLSGNKGY